MRKQFSEILINEMSTERGQNIVLVTADMGYGLWDNIRQKFENTSRFYNVGSAEQLMIGVAAGLSLEGKIPICYSITPFILYRPFEFIRNYLNIEQLNIKIVGGGRDRDYGYLGFTHWAEEDINILDQLKNIKTFKPTTTDELESNSLELLYNNKPSYINLRK